MARTLAALTALAAAVVLGIGTAGPAAAAPAGGPEDPRSVLMGGRAAGGAMMGGYLIVTDFTVGPAGQVLANGTLNAALTGPPGSVQRRVSQPVTIPIDRGASVSTCYLLQLFVGPADMSFAGEQVHLDRSNFITELREGPGRLGSRGRRNTLDLRGCGDRVVFGGLCSVRSSVSKAG